MGVYLPIGTTALYVWEKGWVFPIFLFSFTIDVMMDSLSVVNKFEEWAIADLLLGQLLAVGLKSLFWDRVRFKIEVSVTYCSVTLKKLSATYFWHFDTLNGFYFWHFDTLNECYCYYILTKLALTYRDSLIARPYRAYRRKCVYVSK